MSSYIRPKANTLKDWTWVIEPSDDVYSMECESMVGKMDDESLKNKIIPIVKKVINPDLYLKVNIVPSDNSES